MALLISNQCSILLFFLVVVHFVLPIHADQFEYSKPLPAYLPSYNNKQLNSIDRCWRNKDWSNNRFQLVDCAVGFGSAAIGGKDGKIYVVNTSYDNATDPKPGTLRYGVIQTEPLWIVFAKDMHITLENELIINSYKTLDGRGAKVEISNGPCLTIHRVSNVIVHGISIHDCKPGKHGLVSSSPGHVSMRKGSDGDAISVFNSSNIWIDHCSLANCTDGLIDVIHASTGVTISNNLFSQHKKVMLLGHDDAFKADKAMRVTVVYNKFDTKLVERMPRVRFGYAHVANNYYNKWEKYAIGGSANPTIFSEGNYFIAPDSKLDKLVTKRETNDGWKNWNWSSSNDVFKNGAKFESSGNRVPPPYSNTQAFKVESGTMAPDLTSDAGPLNCVVGQPC